MAEQVTKGGLGFTNAEATALLGTFMGWMYLSPIAGGWISDRFLNPKICVSLGLLIVSAGYFVAYLANNKFMIYLMSSLRNWCRIV